MIAARFAGACWVAAALAVATCAVVVARSSSASTTPPDDDRKWYAHELERADDEFAEIKRKLDVLDRELRDLERDEAARPAQDVEHDAERLLAEQERLLDERYSMSTHCGPIKTTDERIAALDAKQRGIVDRLSELDLKPGPHTVERVRLRRQLSRVAQEREMWQRDQVRDGTLDLE